ncbi:MAG: DnaB-like helicase C-terminal domain-containing protein [Polyangiales bacterium]
MADTTRSGRALADLQAERAVLAAALLDADGNARIIPRVAAVLNAADFHDPRHATIWDSLLTLHQRGVPIDVLTVVAELRSRDRLNAVGGAQYVGELTDEIPTLAHCESHARIVWELAGRRRALESFQAASQRLLAGDPLPVVRSDLTRALEATEDASGAERVGADLDDLLEVMWARREGREKPLATPWRNVDAVLGGGLWPGMYVLVGGTGAGKTQWAVQAAVHAARRGEPVLYLALELSRQDLAARVVGAVSDVPWSRIQRGNVSEAELPRVLDGARRARDLPFHTECGVPFGYGAETLAARAWSLRPSLVVVDYLQLCTGRGGEDARTTVGRVSYVARTIARDLKAAVVVLSSTARANYAELVNDPGRDPGDLVGLGKESGEIEYAADGVLVLARHADRPKTRVLLVAKNRHGPVGRAELTWAGTAFAEGDAQEEISL